MYRHTWFSHNTKKQNQMNENDKKTQNIYLFRDSTVFSSLPFLEAMFLNLPALSHSLQSM